MDWASIFHHEDDNTPSSRPIHLSLQMTPHELLSIHLRVDMLRRDSLLVDYAGWG